MESQFSISTNLIEEIKSQRKIRAGQKKRMALKRGLKDWLTLH